MPTSKEEQLISIRDVAARLRLSTRAVYRLIASQQFPAPVKIGAATRFYESDLDEYLNRLKEERSLSLK